MSERMSLLLLALLLVSLTIGLTLWARRTLAARVLGARARRGRVGEQQAQALLERQGYQVLEAQLSQETGLWVDGVWHPVLVRADFLAARAGKRYVVEVKTGELAPDPTSTGTRRQLLEYAVAFEADGLLLADMERQTLHSVNFKLGEAPGEKRVGLKLLGIGVCLGLPLGALLMWWLKG